MKKLMILGASILQLPAIIEAKNQGFYVIAVDMDKNAIGLRYADKVEIVSTIDIDGVLKVAQKEEIDGIMTLASDMPMLTVATVAQKMHLVGVTIDTALKATNKYEMRLALKKNNVPIPLFFKVNEKNEYLACLAHFKQSCIVKPADNSGSRGIYLINDLTDAKQVNEAYEHSKSNSRNGDILLEEYMIGAEVSVETISHNAICHVIQITDKITTGAPFFVEMGHSQPSQLSLEVQNRIKEVAVAATQAIGITDGPAHVEIKVTENGPKTVELGARLGGDNITTHLVPLSTGVNMVLNSIKIALGMEPDLNFKYKKASAIKYFDVPQGNFSAIYNVDAAKLISGVKQISIVKKIGDVIGDIESSNDRIGFAIAQADTPEEALLICDKVLQTVRFKVE